MFPSLQPPTRAVSFMGTIVTVATEVRLQTVYTVQGESIATAKGPTDSVCLREHRLVPAWEPTMASGYCLGLGFHEVQNDVNC